jgi:hypothetical protein
MIVFRLRWSCSLLLGGWLWVGSPVVVLSMPESPTQVLQTQQARWRDRHLTDYQFTLQIRIFAPPPANQPLQVTVKQGKIVKIVNLSDNRQIPLTTQPEVKTIDQLFAIVDGAIQQNVEKLDVTYHPDLGYPTQIEIDPLLIRADDEVGYFISDLKPL